MPTERVTNTRKQNGYTKGQARKWKGRDRPQTQYHYGQKDGALGKWRRTQAPGHLMLTKSALLHG